MIGVTESVRRDRTKRVIKRALVVLAIAFAVAGVAGVGAVVYFVRDGVQHYGELNTAKIDDLPLTTQVYDKNGVKVASLHGAENRIPIDIDILPDHVISAFLAAEDTRFFEHFGIDVKRIMGAAVHDIRTGGLTQGASTITQQLVKLTHLSADKTWTRKLYEAYLAIQLERSYSKPEILTRYLNVVYFGSGAYGLEAAARGYFGASASELSVGQAAFLAGILKSPTYNDPYTHMDNALERRAYVLKTMRDVGMIDEKAYLQANAEKVKLSAQDNGYPFGWYLDRVAYESQQALGISADELLSGGYTIYTSLDPALQSACEEIYTNPDNFPKDASDGTKCESAAAVIDSKTGGIMALIGGREHKSRRAFSRATDARRQPGSSLKPIAVYAPAVERGSVPSTFVDDTPGEFGSWSPRNFNDSYLGLITLRTALAKSQNVSAVRLLESMGVEAAMDSMRRFGMTTTKNDAYLPVSLGSMADGVTPLEMARAYAALSNEGMLPTASAITSIRDAQGGEIWTKNALQTRAVSKETAYIVTDMLRSAALWGTAKPVGLLKFPAAAKTGTVAQAGGTNRDAWTCAYTTGVTVSVWMGFDSPSETHTLPASITGGTMPAKLAASLLSAAYDGVDPKSVADFAMPSTVHAVDIDGWTLDNEHRVVLASGLTPSKYVYREIFTASNMPSAYTDHWIPPQLPAAIAVARGENDLPVISMTAVQDFARYRVFRRQGTAAAVEIAALTGLPGERIQTVDSTVQRGVEYQFYVTAENAESQDAGLNSRTSPSFPITYYVPLESWFEVLPGIRIPLPDAPAPTPVPPESLMPSLPMPSESTPEPVSPEHTPTPSGLSPFGLWLQP